MLSRRERDLMAHGECRKRVEKYFKAGDVEGQSLFKRAAAVGRSAWFGEVSIVSRRSRQATIVASSRNPLHVIKVPGSAYLRVLDTEVERLNFTLKQLEKRFPLTRRELIIGLSYEFKEISIEKN